MPVRPFVDWKSGLFLDYDKELWPFVRKMDVWIWGKIIDDQWVDGGHHFTVTREDVKNRTGRIMELNNHVALWSIYPSVSFRYQLLYDFTILRIHTKGGVVLKTTDDIKSFLLI